MWDVMWYSAPAFAAEPDRIKSLEADDGGRGEIRTHGELAPTAVFKTAALNHSATRPSRASVAHSTASFKPATTNHEHEKKPRSEYRAGL
jgi:hypothetical protein